MKEGSVFVCLGTNSGMKSLLILVTLLSGCYAAACAPVRAWEKQKLAHPTMTPGEISNGLDGHVRAVSEGATGGLSGGGGGCGCN